PASLKGYIPAEEARGEFGRVLGPAAGVLEVAAGVPDENWTSFALQGLSALRPMKSASLRISDTELVLTGVAPNPAARAAVDAALSGLPEGYNATVDVRTEDDGQPFGFSIQYMRGGDAVVRGKLPVSMGPGDFASFDARLETDQVAIAEIPSPDGQFSARAAVLIDAISQLEEAQTSVREGSATITGKGTRAALAQVEDMLASLPSGFTVTTDFAIFDDGEPIALVATKSARGTDLSGKLPFGTTPADVGWDTLGPDVRIAEVDAKAKNFNVLAMAGLAALAQLQDGTIRVEDAATPGLVLEGTVATPDVSAEIEAVLSRAPGSVELALTALDDGEPLSLLARKDMGGISAEGKVPQDASLQLGPEVRRAGIPLAPSGFEAAATVALDALDELQTGEVSIDGTAVSLSGSGDRAALARAIGALDGLPEGYETQVFLEPLDDGLPLGLTAEKVGDVVTMVGKMPFGTEPQSLGLDEFGEAMIVSEIDPRSEEFLAVAQAGLTALAGLEAGQLTVADAEEPEGPPTLVLSGAVTRAGLETVNGALSTLPNGVAPSIDVVFADDGAPMTLSVRWDGSQLTLRGKAPVGTTAEDLGTTDLAGVTVAEIAGVSEDFTQLAAGGVEAVQLLESGQFEILDATEDGAALALSLSGTALTPAVRDAALAAIGQDGIAADIAVLDDGTPPAFIVAYDAEAGASVSGKLPVGLNASDLADRLGLRTLESSATAGLVGDATVYDEDFKMLRDAMPEVDTLEARFDASGISSLEITPAPGVDADLLAENLGAALGQRPTLADPMIPKAGARRVNALSGGEESFTGTAWLPVMDIDVSLDACDAASRAVLAASQINFVTGSARLEAQSVRSVNGLAAVISQCVTTDPGLRVELGGHTDADGPKNGNLTLSQARAEAVADALILRGVPSDAISAVGYGESQPVADNGTPEGRAANRRTEITWTDS
ncbi:MAG: OmpA family protein, partial [Pseudomonadota bacterium]